jgi:hypothetical protein
MLDVILLNVVAPVCKWQVFSAWYVKTMSL